MDEFNEEKDEELLNESEISEDLKDLKNFLSQTDTATSLAEVADKDNYDFRADFSEKIVDKESEDKISFFQVNKIHLIGIGILSFVLLLILLIASFSSKDEEPVPVLQGDETPVKVEPENPGGMNIKDQDRIVYRRLRDNNLDTKVEKVFPVVESPIEPLIDQEMKDKLIQAPKVVLPPVTKKVVPAPTQPKVLITNTPTKAPEKKVETTKPVEVKKTVAPIKYWRVQLISLGSEEKAKSAWPIMKQKYPSLLGNMTYDVQRADVNGKVYYRLRTGQFKTRSEAETLCQKLKNGGQPCSLIQD